MISQSLLCFQVLFKNFFFPTPKSYVYFFLKLFSSFDVHINHVIHLEFILWLVSARDPFFFFFHTDSSSGPAPLLYSLFFLHWSIMSVWNLVSIQLGSFGGFFGWLI